VRPDIVEVEIRMFFAVLRACTPCAENIVHRAPPVVLSEPFDVQAKPCLPTTAVNSVPRTAIGSKRSTSDRQIVTDFAGFDLSSPELTLVDDFGNRASRPIVLAICRT